ncbi:MAG: hypothetical protein RSC43_01010 [Clostridia bacterium]
MNGPLRIIIIACVTVLSYLFMREVTGVHLSVYVNQLLGKTLGFVKEESRKQTIKNSREFGRMSAAQRDKSILWKYYSFVEDLLSSLKIKQYGITVEGMTVLAVLIAALITALTQLIMPGVFMFVVVIIIVYVSLLAALYLASRIGAQNRKRDTLNTIDILCSVMQDGLLIAVETSMNLIPHGVKPYFTKFLRNVNNLNYSVEEAVTILNSDMGQAFDEFCETAIIYERDRAPGMEMLFSFIVENNAKESLRDVKIRRTSDAVNRDFFATCGIMVLMLLYTIFAYPFVAQFYLTDMGHIFIMLYILTALITFIITQYVMGQPYKYKEK